MCMAYSQWASGFTKGSVFLPARICFIYFVSLLWSKHFTWAFGKSNSQTSVLPIDSLYVSVILQASSRSERWGYLSTQNTPVDLHSHHFADRCKTLTGCSGKGVQIQQRQYCLSGDVPAYWGIDGMA